MTVNNIKVEVHLFGKQLVRYVGVEFGNTFRLYENPCTLISTKEEVNDFFGQLVETKEVQNAAQRCIRNFVINQLLGPTKQLIPYIQVTGVDHNGLRNGPMASLAYHPHFEDGRLEMLVEHITFASWIPLFTLQTNCPLPDPRPEMWNEQTTAKWLKKITPYNASIMSNEELAEAVERAKGLFVDEIHGVFDEAAGRLRLIGKK